MEGAGIDEYREQVLGQAIATWLWDPAYKPGLGMRLEPVEEDLAQCGLFTMGLDDVGSESQAFGGSTITVRSPRRDAPLSPRRGEHRRSLMRRASGRNEERFEALRSGPGPEGGASDILQPIVGRQAELASNTVEALEQAMEPQGEVAEARAGDPRSGGAGTIETAGQRLEREGVSRVHRPLGSRDVSAASSDAGTPAEVKNKSLVGSVASSAGRGSNASGSEHMVRPSSSAGPGEVRPGLAAIGDVSFASSSGVGDGRPLSSNGLGQVRPVGLHGMGEGRPGSAHGNALARPGSAMASNEVRPLSSGGPSGSRPVSAHATPGSLDESLSQYSAAIFPTCALEMETITAAGLELGRAWAPSCFALLRARLPHGHFQLVCRHLQDQRHESLAGREAGRRLARPLLSAPELAALGVSARAPLPASEVLALLEPAALRHTKKVLKDVLRTFNQAFEQRYGHPPGRTDKSFLHFVYVTYQKLRKIIDPSVAA